MKMRDLTTVDNLYVHRQLINSKEFYSWAESQGFENIVPSDKMHATIVYSRDGFDTSSVNKRRGQNKLTVEWPNDRKLERFGESVVMIFKSPKLAKRWQEYRDAGAIWDYEEYNSHVTISYKGVPEDMDISSIVPFSDPLIFGPEIWEPLNEGWKDSLDD